MTTATATAVKWQCLQCKKTLSKESLIQLILEADASTRHKHSFALAEGVEWT